MCGIAGLLDPAGVREDDVRRMADALAHRGPDDATVHVEQGLGLGFRRLAIIDLVTGRQPIANEDGSLLVILNGEIYNYHELRRDLIARGHGFRTQSDTEVLVHLYEERGAAMVRELRGMFAFALWDRRRRTLLLARDHLGQKPLYWAHVGDRFVFASEIKAILQVEPSLRRLDPQALHDYLSLRIIPDPRSMFAGVHKLPPAHTLTVSEGLVKLERYWELRYEPKRRVSEAEALDELDHVARETVRLHLVSDVPVGVFLSGGIDSGLVTALAHEAVDEPLNTFSVSVPYGAFDEAPAARAVAERFGTRHVEGAIGGDLVSALPAAVYHLDEPADPLSVCLYYLSELTRKHVKVALGGDGGDELFGGYDRYYGNRYVRYYAALPRVIRRHVVGRLLDWAPDGFWYKSLSNKLRWMQELADVPSGRRYARSLSYFYFTPRLREQLYGAQLRTLVHGSDPEAAIHTWYDDERAKEALDQMLLADSMVRLPNHSVMILDRMSMAHGLEARSPFMDHRLAEYAATLPVRLKVRGTRRRYLEMKLARRYLPDAVLNRPKQGFSSALPYMMSQQFRALFDHFLPSSHLVQLGLLRQEGVRGLLESHLTRREDHGNRLWLLLNAELWYRVHIEGQPVDALTEEIGTALHEATAGKPHTQDGPPPAGAQ